ncbi:unnamed protein product [Trifolium pratense]|uniref:Uncharacterized protein n=1 Tax=Trifolium pratense TaxID=57577 RepID=A0ACB0LFT2_TRIPR|nr:unnamed protein product [Trifolium pratense]
MCAAKDSDQGVEGATIEGDSKDELEVTGEGVDSVRLTSLLRKKFGHAELGKAEEKKDEEIVTWPYTYSVPHYPVYQIRNSYQYEDPSCSIM